MKWSAWWRWGSRCWRIRRTGSTPDPIVDCEAGSAQALGQQAEQLAADFLARRGLSIVMRNVRCRGGEIDLVCLERDTLVFVEVRLRNDHRFGGAAASITAAKQRRIVIAARWWLNGRGQQYAGRACRFDALLFDGMDERRINWVRDAFQAQK